MKKRILNSISIFVAVSLLASCATMPGGAQNSAERQILVQAVATSAVIGGVAGGAAGAALSKKNRGTNALIGASAGTIVGSIAGYLVAKQQILSYRNIQLENDRLAELLKSARQYNYSVAAYNDNLQQEIAQLKGRTEPEQKRIAKERLKQAEEQRTYLMQAIAERQQLSETLVLPQKVQYQETLKDLNKEDQKLDRIIKELRRISEPARIGS